MTSTSNSTSNQKTVEELPEKFAKWKGVDRTLIEWHPIIDENKCVGCGMCVTSCGRSVFGYNYIKHKAEVARPLQCMVGCTSCNVWCIYDAISFPDKEIVRDFIKEHKLHIKATKAIKEAKND
ncbi:MAG: 4Fe-4S dicluster domain-containing protein [Promethearchaeota archaeon]